MERIRQVIAYKNYFEDFLLEQPKKVQDKIYKIVEAIETFERIPANYLKFIEGTQMKHQDMMVISLLMPSQY